MRQCDNSHPDTPASCWKQIGVWGDKSCPELAQCLHCYHCDVYVHAGRRLFDRKPPDDYVRAWKEQLASPKEERLSGCISVLVFRVGQEWFAMRAGLVNEVLELHPVHSIPHHQTGILRGLINVHGELQLCVSIEKFLAVELDDSIGQEHDSKVMPRMLLVSNGAESLAFEVSEVACVYACHPDLLEDVPTTLPRERVPLLKGLLHWQQHHVAVLNGNMLLEKLLEKIR
ncbi:MAG: chemotaxis protein CheW [Mariprofundus sp.]